MRVLDVIKPLYEAVNDPRLTASNAIHSANLLSSITDKIPEEDGIKLVKFNDYLEKIIDGIGKFTNFFRTQPAVAPEEDDAGEIAQQPAPQPLAPQPPAELPPEEETIQEGTKYNRRREYHYPDELAAAKENLETIKAEILYLETVKPQSAEAEKFRERGLHFARTQLDSATRTFAGFKAAVDERNLFKKQKEEADKFLQEIAKYLTVLGDRVQGFSESLDTIDTGSFTAGQKKKITNAQNFTATLRQALFGLIIEMANKRETSVTPEQIKNFLKACVDRQVIDMNAVVSADRGNIRDSLNGQWADVFDLFTRPENNIFDYSPGKTGGAIGPGELALSMMGSPTRKAEGHGDLEVNGEMYEIKAGKQNGGRLNSNGIGSATTGWKVWSSIIEKIVKGSKNKEEIKQFPGAPTNARFKNTDNHGYPVFVNPADYSANYVNTTTKKDSKKTTYKVASKYNWNSKGIDQLNSEVLIHSTRPATVELFVKTFRSIFNNFDPVSKHLAYLGLPSPETLIGNAIADDGKSITDFDLLNEAITAIAFASYHLSNGVENIMFLNTTTLDYTISRGKDGDPSDLIGKLQSKEVVITGGFNWNDSQQTPTPAYNAGTN
jgi:hypothetical protein